MGQICLEDVARPERRKEEERSERVSQCGVFILTLVACVQQCQNTACEYSLRLEFASFIMSANATASCMYCLL